MKDRSWVGHPDEMPHFGRGEERGPRRGGGGRRERMERGMLRLIVLEGLQSGARHGYEVMKWAEEKTGGAYSPSPGILYPTLQLLEDEGAIEPDSEGERRSFTLTDAGRKELKEHEDRLKEVWERFSCDGPPTRKRHSIRFLEEDLEALNGTIWSGAREAVERDDSELLKKLRRMLAQWREEARDAIAEEAARTGTP